LERGGIVPTCDSGLRVFGFLLVWHGEEWADLIVACGLVRVDIGILLVGYGDERADLTVAITIPAVPITIPAASTVVDKSPA